MEGIEKTVIIFRGKEYIREWTTIPISERVCGTCKKVMLYPIDSVYSWNDVVECTKCYHSEGSKIKELSTPNPKEAERIRQVRRPVKWSLHRDPRFQ